jgi:uncharacterized protein (DUF433 family)
MERPSVIDVRNRPAYSVGEAASYVHMSPATLQSWALGRKYPIADGEKTWPALFEIADRDARRLSFANLVEANVLAALRRDHRIAMPKVRAALDFVRERLRVNRPLLDQQFETDGVDLFVEHYGNLINASRSGQHALEEMIRAALRRIERDDAGFPIRLFPIGPRASERSPYVAFDPMIAFGRPAIVGAGAPVEVVYDRFEAGDSTDDLAADYGVERAAIEEAIRQAGHFRRAA